MISTTVKAPNTKKTTSETSSFQWSERWERQEHIQIQIIGWMEPWFHTSKVGTPVAAQYTRILLHIHAYSWIFSHPSWVYHKNPWDLSGKKTDCNHGNLEPWNRRIQCWALIQISQRMSGPICACPISLESFRLLQYAKASKAIEKNIQEDAQVQQKMSRTRATRILARFQSPLHCSSKACRR